VTTPGEAWRLFVAIELPDTWLEALSKHVQSARQHFGPQGNVSWSRPEGFHMTLKFIGPFDAANVLILTERLSRLIAASPKFRMVLQATYAFGGRPIPRIYAAGYGAPEHAEALEALHRKLDRAFVDLGVPKEGRKFLPHITLARIRPGISRQTYDAFVEAIRAAPQPEAPLFDVEHISLMRSHLGPGGARYERVAAFAPQA
jgi:2'-5' RNA ligase